MWRLKVKFQLVVTIFVASSAVQNFLVENLGLRAVKLSWQKPDNSNGEIIGYTVTYRMEGTVSNYVCEIMIM